MASQIELDRVILRARKCRLCEPDLPLGARPIIAAHSEARILLVGQAPGTRVHETGVAWNDASGERMRQWLSVDADTFYDPRQFAIIPMGFCYPGRGRSGDNPPRPECAPLWHDLLLEQLPDIRLTLLVGQYAQARYLTTGKGKNLTETVRSWEESSKGIFPLPHPSPRNNVWLRKNPWFERDLVPALRRCVEQALKS